MLYAACLRVHFVVERGGPALQKACKSDQQPPHNIRELPSFAEGLRGCG